MFDANGVPHLNDFGMATLLIDPETYETSTMADNLLWCPPEYRSPESTVPLKTTREGDVYSFGSIIFTVSSLYWMVSVGTPKLIPVLLQP
jgi:serine/threonine protein kinase